MNWRPNYPVDVLATFRFCISQLATFSMAAIVLFAPSPSCLAGEGKAPRYYSAQFDFEVDGAPIASPSALVEFGQEAEISVGSKDGLHGWALKFTVDDPFVAAGGATAVQARIRLLETEGGQQRLLAEPQVALQVGERGEMEFPLDRGRRAKLGLRIQVQSDTDLVLNHDAAGHGRSAHRKCARSAVASSQEPDSAPRCCSGKCTDGEQYQCCNVISCCVCGACCSPH